MTFPGFAFDTITRCSLEKRKSFLRLNVNVDSVREMAQSCMLPSRTRLAAADLNTFATATCGEILKQLLKLLQRASRLRPCRIGSAFGIADVP